MNLEIFIITYNRESDLENTLRYFVGSVLKDYSITILDNCSTDNTSLVHPKFENELPNLKYLKNKVNIGGNANILRAIEFSTAEYTWVVCDDDILDFSQFDDVFEIIEKGIVNLIQVGGHPQKSWAFGGQLSTPRKLLSEGYPYFKFSSFLPTNIFRTRLFQMEFLRKGYDNIVNSYPHMPYTNHFYYLNEDIYISKKQIVTATMGTQSYSKSDWYLWWMGTCSLLNNKEDVRLAFFDQWHNIGESYENDGIEQLYWYNEQNPNDVTTDIFIKNYFNKSDKIYIKNLSKKIKQKKIKEKIKSIFPALTGLIKKLKTIRYSIKKQTVQ